jgi:hypothetical protein
MNRSQNIDNCGKKKNLKENFIEKQLFYADLVYNKSGNRS